MTIKNGGHLHLQKFMMSLKHLGLTLVASLTRYQNIITGELVLVYHNLVKSSLAIFMANQILSTYLAVNGLIFPTIKLAQNIIVETAICGNL